MTTPAKEKKETGERIQIRRDRPWGSVPESLVVDVKLGPTARLLAVWLCIRPPNWIVRRGHVLDTLGIGLDSWWRARRELIEHGYLVEHPNRNAGRFTTADLEFFPQPDLANLATATAHGFTEPGKSEPGSTELGKAEPLPITLQTIPKRPPPQTEKAAVVVSKIEIHWPAGLAEEQIDACWEAVQAAAKDRQQCIVDELAGAMANKPIRSPAGWLRGLMEKELRGGAVLEFAPSIAKARAARVAAAARSAAAMRAPGSSAPPLQVRDRAAPQHCSEARTTALAALGQLGLRKRDAG